MPLLLTLPGASLCALIAVGSIVASGYVAIGSVAIAIMLGIFLGNLMPLGTRFNPGIGFAEKRLLAIAIGLMGINLDFTILQELGSMSILMVVLGLLSTLLFAILCGKIFGFDGKFALLLGIGNGVCGSSAIAATEQIIGARKEDVGLSIAIVNFLGTLGILLVPFLATAALSFDSIHAGALIGNTLQAVGQVIAGGFAIDEVAGQTATIIKMTRILMLTPLILGLLLVFSKKNKGSSSSKFGVPPFIIGFCLMTLIPSFQLLPEKWIHLIGETSHLALVVAMAGIGLKISFSSILQSGKAALGIGSLVFAMQILTSTLLVSLLI